MIINTEPDLLLPYDFALLNIKIVRFHMEPHKDSSALLECVMSFQIIYLALW
jgi:hypothetical protein